MRKRIGLFFLSLLGIVAVFLLYSWHEESRRRAEKAREALGLIRQEIDEKAALAKLGDINIDPAGLTLAKLNKVLQRPSRRLSGNERKAVRLGWACGGELCAVVAYFLVSAGNEVPLSTTPVELYVSGVGFGKSFQGSIGGIHLGDSIEKLIGICRQRGYQPQESKNRISWDKDWEIGWTEMDGKISSLIFFNMTLMNSAQAKPVEFGEKR